MMRHKMVATWLLLFMTAVLEASAYNISIGLLAPYDQYSAAHIAMFAAAIEWYNSTNPSWLEGHTVYGVMRDVLEDVELLESADLLMSDRICMKDEGNDEVSFTGSVNPVGLDVDIVVGGLYSSRAVLSSLIAEINEVPIVGVAATSDDLSNKVLFPLFSRIVSSDLFQAPYLVNLIQDFGWDDFAIIHSVDEYGMNFLRQVIDASHTRNLSVSHIVPFDPAQPNNDTLIGSLRRIKLTARKVIVLAVSTNVDWIFEVANLEDMTGNGYVWLGTDGVISLMRETPLAPETVALAHGALMFFPVTDPASNMAQSASNAINTLAWRERARLADSKWLPPDSLPPVSGYTYYMWDAVLLAVQSVVSALNVGGGCIDDGRCIQNFVRNESVNGSTGTFSLNESTGDRTGTYSVYNIRSNGTLVQVGTIIDGDFQRNNVDIIWSTGDINEPVPPSTVLPIVNKNSENFAIAVIVAIITIMILSGAFLLWRRRKNFQENIDRAELGVTKRALEMASDVNKQIVNFGSSTFHRLYLVTMNFDGRAAANEDDLFKKLQNVLPITKGQAVYVEDSQPPYYFGRIVASDAERRHNAPVQSGWFPALNVRRAVLDDGNLEKFTSQLRKTHRILMENYTEKHRQDILPLMATLRMHRKGISKMNAEELTRAMWTALEYNNIALVVSLIKEGACVSERHSGMQLLPHVIVLGHPEFHHKLLRILFQKCCRIDVHIGGLLKHDHIFERLAIIFREMAAENWCSPADDGDTVLHIIVKSCYSGAMKDCHTIKMAKEILSANQDLLLMQNSSSRTAGDIAMLCNNEDLQRVLTLTVFGRYQLMKTDAIHRSSTSIVLEVRDTLRATKNTFAKREHATRRPSRGSSSGSNDSGLPGTSISQIDHPLRQETQGLVDIETAPPTKENSRRLCLKMVKKEVAWRRELESRAIVGKNLSEHCVPVLAAVSTVDNSRRVLGGIHVDYYCPTGADMLAGRKYMQEYPFAILLPLADRNLLQIITNEMLATDSVNTIRALALKIGRCIEALHNSGIVHGDIKPRNIVRTLPNRSIALIDFDMCFALRGDIFADLTMFRTFADTEGIIASSAYVSPELYRSIQSNNERKFTDVGVDLDIWGWGVTLYEMITGTSLFRHTYDRAAAQSIVRLLNWDGLRAEEKSNIICQQRGSLPIALLDLFDWVLHPDPAARPKSMTICLQHAFFNPQYGRLREHFVQGQIREALVKDRNVPRPCPPILISYCTGDTDFAIRLALALAPLVDALRYDALDEDALENDGANIDESLNGSLEELTNKRIVGIDTVLIVMSPHREKSRIGIKEQQILENSSVRTIAVYHQSTVPSSPTGGRLRRLRSVDEHDSLPVVFSDDLGLFDISFRQELLPRLAKEMEEHDFGSTVRSLQDAFGINSEVSHKPKELPRSFITFGDVLGQGEFGIVRQGWLQPVDGERSRVAIKQLRSDNVVSEESRRAFLLEAAINGQFHHKNVIALIGVVTAGDPNLIVLEYCGYGALVSLLQKKDFDKTQLLRFSYEVASGMEYLAGMNFIHRDLAARNCLVDGDNVVKVADFGMTKALYDSAYYTQTTIGAKLPLRWLAPELFESQKFTKASDVWAFGVTVIEIFTRGATPYGDWSNEIVITRVASGYILPCPPECPLWLYSHIIVPCFEIEGFERPSFEVINGLFKDEVVGASDTVDNAECGVKYEGPYEALHQKVGSSVVYQIAESPRIRDYSFTLPPEQSSGTDQELNPNEADPERRRSSCLDELVTDAELIHSINIVEGSIEEVINVQESTV